jgi:DNA-binding CsgD family transcriptional regulator
VKTESLATHAPSRKVGKKSRLRLILLSDPDTKPTPRGRHLVAIFGLTPAEARLAIDLASGERVEEISVRRGLKVSTVRSQLSSILAKTGTTGQTALLRLLGGVPAVGAD